MKKNIFRTIYYRLTVLLFVCAFSSNAQTITNVSTDTVLCAGSSVQVTFIATGFSAGTTFQVLLSDASGNFLPPNVIGFGTTSPITATIPAASIASGNYLLTVASAVPVVVGDTFGTIEIVVPGTAFDITTSATPTVVCEGSNVTLNSTIISGAGAITYNWYYDVAGVQTSIGTTSSITTNAIPAGATVGFTATSNLTCLIPNPLDTLVAVTVSPISAGPPQITIYQDIAFCDDANGQGVFHVAPIVSGATYTWIVDGTPLPPQPIATQLKILRANVVAGQQVKCEISISGACLTTNTSMSNIIVVNILTTPEVTITEDFEMTYGDDNVQLQIFGLYNAATISWTPKDKSLIGDPTSSRPFISPPRTQTYQLSVVALNGCLVKAEVEVTVVPNKNLYFPDAFSPNADDFNDVFYCRSVLNQFASKTFLMQIFDENGTRVFESKYENYGWDGTFRNKPVEEGCYIYHVTGAYFNSEPFDFKGKILLIR